MSAISSKAGWVAAAEQLKIRGRAFIGGKFVLSPEVFAKAQEIIEKRKASSRVSVTSSRCMASFPPPSFGLTGDRMSLSTTARSAASGRAYAKMGYKQPCDIADLERLEKVKRITNAVTGELMDLVKANGATVSVAFLAGRLHHHQRPAHDGREVDAVRSGAEAAGVAPTSRGRSSQISQRSSGWKRTMRRHATSSCYRGA